MLINLRNAMMTGKRLPYDSEVEYLQSSGTQWIDTGYSFNSATDKVELVFELLTTTPDYKWVFGAYDATGGQYRLSIGRGWGTNRKTFGYGTTTSYVNDNLYYYGPHNYVADTSGAGIDGTTLAAFANFATESNIFLFSIPLYLTAYCSNSRIWSHKHYRNNTLVRDYIPVRKGTVGYLYDRVSGKLFGNAGSGDFVLGPDVVPVEYIESHGTEYIDTGIKLTSNDVVDITASRTNDNSFFGSTETSKWFNVTVSSGNTTFRFGANTKRAPRPADGQVSSMSCGRKWIVDGTEIGTETLGDFASSHNCGIFARIGSAAGDYLSGRVYKFDLTTNGTKVMGLLPVRVGTEGAMMDTLTRRIYRNAGTGAFTYGNDLKYPIPA